jgi:hypothetical protein
VPRVQVQFLTAPGQIAGGLFLLAALAGAMLAVWHGAVEDIYAALPGLPSAGPSAPGTR